MAKRIKRATTRTTARKGMKKTAKRKTTRRMYARRGTRASL